MTNGTIEKEQTILVLIDDDYAQYSNLELTALRYYGEKSEVEFVAGEKTSSILEQLPRLKKEMPDARIDAIMDYNMNLNVKGEQKPTESLFFEPDFQHFLKNGGIIVIYSGYPEQVHQSHAISSANAQYENLVLLIAEKSSVEMEDVFRFLSKVPRDKLGQTKRFAQRLNYDLKEIIAALRSADNSF